MEVRALIYSENRFFVDSFSAYIMSHHVDGVELAFFSDRVSAQNYLGQQRVEMIFADRDFLENATLPAKAVRVCLSDRTRVSVGSGRHECNIYQRGTDIVADLMKIMAAAGDRENMIGDIPQKIAVFYSPQGGSGKTILAYSCALLCAKSGTAVYLNLEEFGYTGHLYQVEFDTDMETVMFSLKDGRDVQTCLSNAVKKDRHNVYVMPELKTVGDFHEMSGENAEKLVRQLSVATGCSCLILDLSGELNERNRKLLELSDVSFWVFSDDQIGKGKLERVRNDQSIGGMNEFGKTFFVLNKCHEKNQDSSAVRIPFSESLSRGTDVETVLAGNRDFNQKCMEVLDLIEMS